MSLRYLEQELWLSQFSHSHEDEATAQTLLDACHSISRERFTDDLSYLLKHSFGLKDRVAFFVERELKKNKGVPHRMYKVRKIKVNGKKRYKRQSYGAANPVVSSKTLNSQKVGSEGLIANFLTKKIQQLNFGRQSLLQPTIEEIKKKKINKIVIVSDLIGTGRRMLDMINSIWISETVKSWHSLKYIEIYILCYACTENAELEILRHKAAVRVIKVMPCPTIYSEFDEVEKKKVIDLCHRYGSYSDRPLGYEKSGVLMSFYHSTPNNCPAILGEGFLSAKKSWAKLFDTPYQTSKYYKSTKELYNEIEKNTYIRLGFNHMHTVINESKCLISIRRGILLAFLLDKEIRKKMDIISFTRAPLAFILNMFTIARNNNLVKLNGIQLRAEGKSIVRLLKAKETSYKKSFDSESIFYYPTSLRAPKTGV